MSEWISVKDRLPEPFEDVLTYDDKCKIIINWLEEIEDEIPYFAYSGKTITHWMPLPEPPEHETTTFKPIDTDTRGYACQFSCNACDCTVSMAYYMHPSQFDYNYCPYCGRPVESEDDAE